MTILSDIIQQAYRDANLVPIGTDTTTTAEKAEALKRLQVIILSVLGQEMGEGLQSFPIGDNNVTTSWVPTVPSYIPLNTRLVCNLTAAQTVYLHPDPQDGSRVALVDASGNFATYNLTLDGNGRTIDGSATDVRDTDSETAQWFYRADLGDWTPVEPLVAADEMPFPVEFDDLFIIMLAMRLNPRNAQVVSQESATMMERSRAQFRARYMQKIATPSDLAVLNLGRRSFGGGNYRNGWML